MNKETRKRQSPTYLRSKTALAVLLPLLSSTCEGFLSTTAIHRYQNPTIQVGGGAPCAFRPVDQKISSSSALNVWWFGGTEDEKQDQEDSCELVAVRIERTSPNSRRISGEITVPTPLGDVWSILTDYNRLSVHVPNLVNSKIVRPGLTGQPGDGSYQCRLYQKGAQKIIGFEFGADVTMQMTENGLANKEKSIDFKCVDSFFFTEFDGEWKAREVTGENGELETLLSYTVDVRPKGPVPVLALEWRIREDVPTNLRAVKRAAMTVESDSVLSSRMKAIASQAADGVQKKVNGVRKLAKRAAGARPAMAIKVDWFEDETMAAYLNN